jgi:hypothetical protein
VNVGPTAGGNWGLKKGIDELTADPSRIPPTDPTRAAEAALQREARLEQAVHQLQGVLEERTAQVKRLRQRLEAVQAIALGAASASTADDLLAGAARILSTAMDVDEAISLCDPLRETLIVVARLGSGSDVLVIGMSSRMTQPRWECRRGAGGDICDDLALGRRQGTELALKNAGLRSQLTAPMLIRDREIERWRSPAAGSPAYSASDGELLLVAAQQIGSVVSDLLGRGQLAAPPRCPAERELDCGSLIGVSAALREAVAKIELAAPTDTSVLLLGESGTGKELAAREIHKRSKRCSGILVTVNCASIPRELFESEFFGHVKGAFTGALRDRIGRFELANGGTLFLDEVGEIPVDMQAKLLRALEEALRAVGEERTPPRRPHRGRH